MEVKIRKVQISAAHRLRLYGSAAHRKMLPLRAKRLLAFGRNLTQIEPYSIEDSLREAHSFGLARLHLRGGGPFF